MKASPRLPSRLSATALALAVSLVTLAGCGGGGNDDAGKKSSSSTASSSPSASSSKSSSSSSGSDFGAPATGPEVSGTGYTYHLPEGWQDISSQLKASQPGIDSGGRQNPATPPFTANLNTLTTPSNITGTPKDSDLTALSAQIKQEVATLSPNVKAMDNTEIAGAPAVHQEGDAKQGNTTFYLVQYFVVKGANDIGITFAFPTSLTQDQRDKLVNPVLASFSFS